MSILGNYANYDQPRQYIKKQRHDFVNKGLSSQGYGFSNDHVWMWELDYKESWAQKNWCFWTVVLEKILESPLNCKEIQPVHYEGDQSWVFIGRTDVEAATPILWPPAAKSWLIGKDSDAGKDWGQKEKGMMEDEMAGWHHQLNGHGFVWTREVGDGQGGLVCCSSWGHKESDKTEWLNWTEDCIILPFSRTTGWLWMCFTWANGVLQFLNSCLIDLELGSTIMSKWLYYPRQCTDSMQSLSIFQWHFLQN